MVIFAFLMAVFPALFLVRYYYLEDNRKPEPIGLIYKVFFLGILATIPVFFLECLVGYLADFFVWAPVVHAFLEAFFVAALCEELFKWFVIKHYIYNNKHFDEILDGVIYTVVASLGFACMENIIYVMGRPISVAFVRAFTAVPLHAICSGLMGYYIGRSKFVKTTEQRNLYIRYGIIVAIFIHGLYNFVMFCAPYYSPVYSFAIFPVIVITYLELNKKIQLARREDILHRRT